MRTGIHTCDDGQTFLLFFSPKLWHQYDTDGSGYIEADELKNFLRDLLKEAKKSQDVTEDQLIQYTDTMVGVSSHNEIFARKL